MAIVGGYMVPHPPIALAEIGRGEEKKIQASLDAFGEVARDIAAIKPDTMIVTSPHTVMYRDYFHISPGSHAKGNFGHFRAGQVRMEVNYDRDLVNEIVGICRVRDFPAGCMGEMDPNLDHGTMVPLYFINQAYEDYQLVRIGLSGHSLQDHWILGTIIREAVDKLGRKAVFIASGDLSHCQNEDGPYGFRPQGPAYDRRIMDVMGRGAFEELLTFRDSFLEESMECGHRSFTIMGGALQGQKLTVRELAHEATFGVGYGFVIYHCAE